MKNKALRFLSYIGVAALSSVVTIWLMLYWFPESKLSDLENLILTHFIGDADQTAMEDAAAGAMIDSLNDQWSYYIPAAEYATFEEQMENSYVGIGITISQLEDQSGLLVESVVTGGPAEEAGVEPMDIIVSIDGHSTEGMTVDQARTLVRGEEGTSLTITVLRKGEGMSLYLTRRHMEVAVASGKMLDHEIGLVTIYNFDSRCAKETIAAIEELISQGATKLIFDVRNNPGGYATELVTILDYLLPEGELFRTVDYTGKEEVEMSDAGYLDLPMAVLINEESYSAAEFFAAALSEYDAAITVGWQTCGKGYFQQTYQFNDGSAVGLSVGKYFTPKGVSLAGVGVTPDIPVYVDTDTAYQIYLELLSPEEDPQIQAAVSALLDD